MVQLDSEQTTLQSTSDVPANDNTTQNMEHAEVSSTYTDCSSLTLLHQRATLQTDASRLKRVDEYELMTDEKAQNSGLCSDPYGSWRCVSLIVLMVCFIVATPLSLALTIPAYVLADRVSDADTI